MSRPRAVMERVRGALPPVVSPVVLVLVVLVATAWAAVVPFVASWDVAVSFVLLGLGVMSLLVATRRDTRRVRTAVAVALVIRIAILVLHHLGLPLPDSDADETSFLTFGETLASGGWGASLQALLSPTARDANAYSGLLAVVRLLTGGGEVTARMVNVVVGTVIVLLAARIAEHLWGRERAGHAAIITALFPTAILYSVLVLREATFTALMLWAVLSALRWLRTKRIRQLVLVAVAGVGALQLHFGGVAVLAGIGVALVVANGRSRSRGPRGSRIPAVVLVAGLLIGAFALNFGAIGFSLKSGLAVDSISTGIENRARGSAGYLVGDTPDTWQGLVAQAPLRAAYFLYSPLPWQLRTSAQLIGVVDGAAYLLATAILIRRRRQLLRSESARVVLIFLIIFLVFFSFGVSNFGTAIRHRGKAVALFAALLAGGAGRDEGTRTDPTGRLRAGARR